MISYSYMYSATFVFHSTLFWRFVCVNNVDLVGFFLKTLYDIWCIPIVRHWDYFQFFGVCAVCEVNMQRFLKEKGKLFNNYIYNRQCLVFSGSMKIWMPRNKYFTVGEMKLCLLHSKLLVKALLLNSCFMYTIHSLLVL